MVKLLVFSLLLMLMNAGSAGWGEKLNCFSKGFGLIIVTDKAIYDSGQPITINLTVFNYTKDTVSFTFTSSQRYDFFVSKEGKEIWRWSSGKVFAQVIGEEKIKPGESLTYEETYLPKIKFSPGTYQVKGVFTSKDPLEATIYIQIRK